MAFLSTNSVCYTLSNNKEHLEMAWLDCQQVKVNSHQTQLHWERSYICVQRYKVYSRYIYGFLVTVTNVKMLIDYVIISTNAKVVNLILPKRTVPRVSLTGMNILFIIFSYLLTYTTQFLQTSWPWNQLADRSHQSHRSLSPLWN